MSVHEVIIKGGLGNQIFCLFHAYKLSLKTKEKVLLNLSNYSFGNRKDRPFVLDLLYPPLKNEFKISKNLSSKFLYLFSRIYEKFFVEINNNYLPGDDPFLINYWNKRYIHSGYFQKIKDSECDKKLLALFKKRFYPYIK